MLNSVLGQENRYDLTAPKFQTAFAFLRREDLASLAEGWYELEHGVRASVQRYITSPAEQLNFETHVKYFDVQYMVSGVELVGVVEAGDLAAMTEYDPKEDIQFFQTPKLTGGVLLRDGDYVVLAPADAHKPRCAAGEPIAVNKIVVKVPVE